MNPQILTCNKIIFIFFFILLTFFSCENNHYIRHYKIPKSKNIKSTILKSNSNINWKAPSNWVSKELTAMRIGSYDIPYSNGMADLSIIKLKGNAGGIEANVNRWRNQLNLKPHTIKEINNSIKSHKGKVGDFNVITISNPENQDNAFIITIYDIETHTIFIKLNASIKGISEIENEFIEFSKSFKILVEK